MIYLAELTAYNLATSSVETLRFSSGDGYLDAATGNYYAPRIEQPALMRREIFADGQIGGAASASVGELTLVNNDGELDYLTGYAVNGRQLIIKVGDASAAYASFATVLKGLMQQAAMEWERVSIRLRDRYAEFDKPIQTLAYAGTNSLPAGLEGSTDLKDAAKPLFYGRVNNVTPTLINSSRLLYQITTGALAEIVNVFDAGAYLGREADYTNQTDMETNSPSAGCFRIWTAGGIFRLGSSPAGSITATAWEYNTIEGSTAAQIAYRLATGPGGVSAGDTVAADYTALDGQNAGSVGLWIEPGMTIAEALDRITASVGGWWGFDQLGRFRLARFDAPSGGAVATLTDVEILSVDTEAATINGEAVPAWKITLNHDINYTTQAGGNVAGVVAADRRAWLEKPNRQTVAEDATVKTAHPLAQEIVYDTLLAGAGYAGPEAARRLDLLKTSRLIYNATVDVDAALLAALDLGAVVSVQLSRFGLSGGKLLRVIGIEGDYQRNQLNLRLWG
ncbi:hypothetical protein [Methylomicrobium lacus]|uniref:hypothetical protein n=1 Tax=Methylomicrobium lacus TaxID=136992 RepID=UPI00045EC2F3|nr:hypothetical protein [Methylomicrobium lacus]